MNQNNQPSTNTSLNAPTSTPTPIVYDPTRLEISPAFALNQSNLAQGHPRPICWLWQQRIPLGGITLLDGDRNCSKSRLAEHIAACTSTGAPMLDDTPSLQGGVVIVAPETDPAVSQFSFLSSLPCHLGRIEFLSSVRDPETASHPSGKRPFSLPQDFSCLFDTVDRLNARLIILDDFIDLLSRDRRWTEQSLASLLSDFNQQLISRDLACLLIRHCGAKGSAYRPSVLERCEFFQTIAMSRLLVTRDPLQPDRLLLTHARCPHAALAPTLILQTGSRTHDPAIASLSAHGIHYLTAQDVIENRPDVLRRHLLFDYLLQIITESPDPLHVSTLYARSPRSSKFQVQHVLKDLLNLGQIEHPGRGFYSPAPANPVFAPSDAPATPEDEEAQARRWALEEVAQLKARLREKLAREDDPSSGGFRMNPAMEYYFQAQNEDEELQALLAEKKRRTEEKWRAQMPDDDLFADDEANTADDDLTDSDPDKDATTADPFLAAAQASEVYPSPNPQPPTPAPLHCGLVFLPQEYVEERAWRETHFDNPYPKNPESEARVHAAFLRYKAEKDAQRKQP